VTSTPPAGERPIASPALRRRAWELGVDLNAVAGSGPGGRIMQVDLDAHAARAAPVPPRASAVTAAPTPARADEQVRITGLRRRIAQKMQESKRRIPHYTYVEEVDVTELEALRARLNEKHGATRGRLTLLPLLARAIVLAVGEFPQINARFDDETGVITRLGAVHLGIATQTGAGLMVPVLRDADTRDLWANAAEIARVAEAARAGKALRDELTGSSITLTSLGALGGIVSTPVINHPEVAIVGVNRIVMRPVIRDGAVVARRIMNLSSSFDHRVVDGMHAAQFVQALRGLLECPALLFVA
jgi:2-oxoisovalerate dehydrogenase E2 component (dihydrolipoyl transacylase)